MPKDTAIPLMTQTEILEKLRLKAGRGFADMSQKHKLTVNPIQILKLNPSILPVEVLREQIVQQPNYHSFLLLVATFMVYQSEDSIPIFYFISDSIKSKILCQALDSLECLDWWTHPSQKKDSLEDLMGALLIRSSGFYALPYLYETLDDNRLVRFCDGINLFKFRYSREYIVLAEKYQLRRKDLAHRYMLQILGSKPKFDTNVQKRDKSIALFKIWIKKYLLK